MSRKLFLLDGSALVYRAFHALSRMGLRNKQGEPTGAVFGFANTLHALVRQEKPDYIAVVFDAPVVAHALRSSGRDDLILVEPVIGRDPYGIALPSGSDRLEEVNAAVIELGRDGTLDELLDQWFGS